MILVSDCLKYFLGFFQEEPIPTDVPILRTRKVSSRLSFQITIVSGETDLKAKTLFVYARLMVVTLHIYWTNGS